MSATPGRQAPYDAAVVGAGFYGAAIAAYLASQRGLARVALLEREPALLARASFNNQARVHNGYHYPRSFTTAFRSRVNLPRFARDWEPAVQRERTMIYAIARRNSKVTAPQFRRFCREIGAVLRPVDAGLRRLFEPRLVEEVFGVEEYVFDAPMLARLLARRLQEARVEVRLGTSVAGVTLGPAGTLLVATHGPGGEARLAARLVFNCTYSGLNHLGGEFPRAIAGLKHEIAEMALVRPPAALEGSGVTVMDGPFFSLMPFPAREAHTLSHVRYTPQLAWDDAPGIDPHARLRRHDRASRFDRMIRDVARYMPCMAGAAQVGSLFEVKTVLRKNEVDDGRPILFEKHAALPGCYSILGGKIDNIYDVFERLDADPLLEGMDHARPQALHG